MRICAVSVDLDEIGHYYAIHGLDRAAGPPNSAVYRIALERLDSWARALQIPLTLFAVGADLGLPGNAGRLRAMAERGYEIGNHSQDHLYDLTRKDRREILRQVDEGALAIERAVGSRPIGFRAPGYTVSDELYDVLRETGVTYDSSVFPCPAYYLAKAAKMAAIRLQGRSSNSIVDRPTVLAAPTRPYRVGTPYWKRGAGMLELPIQVTRRFRLPFFGTAITLMGPAGARLLTRGVLGEPMINLELHGIDVLDLADGLGELRQHQPDVRVPHGRKMEALTASIDMLRKEGYAFVRLGDAALSLS